MIHEVTTPQAFEGLDNAGRRVRRPDNTLATVDHASEPLLKMAAQLLTTPKNVPTDSRANYKSVDTFIEEADSRLQSKTLEEK